MNTFSVKRLLLPLLATLGLLLVIGWMAGVFSNKVTPEMRTKLTDQAIIPMSSHQRYALGSSPSQLV